MAHATDIVGYAYQGALYCVDCLTEYDSKAAIQEECSCGEVDENGLCEGNCSGYGPNPVFREKVQSSDSCDNCQTPLEEE